MTRYLGIALAIMLLTAARLPAQGALPASTGCIGDSVTTLFQPEVETNPFVKEQLDAHERVHRREIRQAMDSLRLPCAQAFWTLTASPLANLIAEVPAYRAQADWLRTHSTRVFDEAAFYKFVANGLYASYARKLPWDLIHDYLVTGRMPTLSKDPAYPEPSIASADSLLLVPVRP